MTRVHALILVAIVSGAALPSDIPPPRVALTAAEVERVLARGKKFAERGEVDLFIAATAAWKLREEDHRLWVPAHMVGRRAVEKAGLKGDREPRGPGACPDFQTWFSGMKPSFIRTDGVYRRPVNQLGVAPGGTPMDDAVVAAGVDNPQWIRGLVVSRGPVSAKGPINDALILANGDVTTEHKLNGSVVICDGNVIVKNTVGGGSLIIARGKIRIDGNTSNTTLIAGGSVSVAKLRPPPPVPSVETEYYPNILEKQAKPLGYITFFELSRVGVEAKAADGRVTVAAIAEGKPFAKAGVRVGDVIIDVNGKKPTDAESLRRLLRDALAIGDAAVTLRRGDKTEVVKVSLPE